MKMPAAIKVAVSQTDIKKGRKYAADSCPVALAVKRAIGRTAYVTSTTVLINGVCYMMPHAASTFVRAFDSNKIDSNKVVKPFRFTLKLKREVDEVLFRG